LLAPARHNRIPPWKLEYQNIAPPRFFHLEEKEMLRRHVTGKGERRSVAKTGVLGVASKKTEKIEIENVNHPGHSTRGDAAMYEAMKRAFLKILPKTSPGLTVAEIQERVIAHLPEELFPKGAKADWWAKTVQLDLESKGLVAREKTTHCDCASHDIELTGQVFAERSRPKMHL
jgi:hypothetical protein